MQALRAFSIAMDLYEREGGQPARPRPLSAQVDAIYEGVKALGLTPYLGRADQGPMIVTVHQPADPALELQPLRRWR